MQTQTKAYFLAALAVLFWSTAATAFKITLEYLEVIPLVFISSLTAMLITFLFLAVQKKLYLLRFYRKKDYWHSAVLGLLNPFLYYTILFKAYSLLPAQMAQPLNFIWPLMIVLLSIPILKQKIAVRSIFSIVISFIGVIIISTKGKLFSFQIETPFGVFLALFSSIVWALFFLYNVKDERDEIPKLFLSFAFGSFYIWIITLFQKTEISWQGLLGAVYIGIFEMGITFIIWIKALKLSRTTAEVNNLIYLTPFLSLIFINIIVKEKILVSTFIGLILIVSGIILQKRFRKK